jgi:hypothetical protein
VMESWIAFLLADIDIGVIWWCRHMGEHGVVSGSLLFFVEALIM